MTVGSLFTVSASVRRRFASVSAVDDCDGKFVDADEISFNSIARLELLLFTVVDAAA